MLLDLERIGRSERLALARLDDSKRLSTEERERLYPAVIRAAAGVSVAVRSVRAIDTRGLHVSNLGALADCMRAVAGGDGVVRLVDGFPLPRCGLEHTPVVDGDARSAAIAAASVIAKVTRDRYMHRVASLYPKWNFDGNVGYSTPEHRSAIREHGICPLHRRSFASIAYTQLSLGPAGETAVGSGESAASAASASASQPGIPAGEADEVPSISEGVADVIEIGAARGVEADPDDVEAVAGDA